jgi:hypothetical protein
VLSAQLGLVPVDIRVPMPPTPVLAGGRAVLVYELRITNLSPARGLAVREVQVFAPAGQMLARWRDDSLKSAMARVAGGEGDTRVVASGRQSIVYLWVAMPAGAGVTPEWLDHRLLVTHADSLTTAAPDTVRGPTVSPRRVSPPVLDSPFRNGGLWLAANGPDNGSGHRRTAIPVAGVARIAQRFATDWVEFGPDGRLFRGDSTKNENWYGYGEPLVAVAAGRVVAIKDGIPENVPLSPQRAVPVTMETVGGNHVIVDIGGGAFAFYAHLQPGSLRVAVGDRVEAGQPIGLLGNSGNSDAPHLHLHVGDAPSPLGSEGLPFGFDRFRRVGVATDLMAPLATPWLDPSAGEERRGETPLGNEVIRFRPRD